MKEYLKIAVVALVVMVIINKIPTLKALVG
jgi:hypothetical protein